MDLHQYLDAVKKYWWAILIPAVLGAALGVSSAMQADPSYRASVTFFVATRGDASTAAAVQGNQFATSRVNSYVALATTDRLAQLIVDDSGVDLTARQVRAMMGASGDLDTVLLTATITSGSRDLSLRLGESLATQFVALVDDVENGESAEGSVALEVVSGPGVRQVPTRPSLSIATNAAFGVLLGLGAAVLLHLRDHTVRSQADLRALGLDPTLGSIPFDRRERALPLYVEDRMQPATAEAFRHLRTSLQFLDVDNTAQVIVVSSSIPGEGKSFVSRNLALTIAASNHRVLLIEADLRRPTLSEAFGLKSVPGLSDVLAGRADLDAALRPWGSTGLSILPSGYLPPNPSELLGSDAAKKLLMELRSRFEYVLIDTPPLLPVTDGAVVAGHADGVVLVVRQGKTSRHQLAVSEQRLAIVGARFLGSVMNMVTEAPAGSYSTYERAGGSVQRLGPRETAPLDAGSLDPGLLDPVLLDPDPRPHPSVDPVPFDPADERGGPGAVSASTPSPEGPRQGHGKRGGQKRQGPRPSGFSGSGNQQAAADGPDKRPGQAPTGTVGARTDVGLPPERHPAPPPEGADEVRAPVGVHDARDEQPPVSG